MTFWLGVAVAYLLIVNAGLVLGRYLSRRFPGRRDDGGGSFPTPTPEPVGPSHALECRPLGSAFDRALLPGAFDPQPVADAI